MLWLVADLLIFILEGNLSVSFTHQMECRLYIPDICVQFGENAFHTIREKKLTQFSEKQNVFETL